MLVCEYKEKKAANQRVIDIYIINKEERERVKKMELELYWFDKNWKQRGEGRNAHLIIDYERRTYRYFTSYTLNGYDYNAIQVGRKGDLDDYMKELDAEGFLCIN